MGCPEWMDQHTIKLLVMTLEIEMWGKQFLTYSLFPQQSKQLQIKPPKADYINSVKIFLAIVIFSCHVEV